MRMSRTHTVMLAAAWLAAGASASAQEAPAHTFGTATPLAQLQVMTGGTDTHITNNLNEQDTNGTLTDNTAKGTVSGSNFVGDNALSNSAGLPTVIQNSGNNVLIQNSTIVNVRMNP